MTEQNVVRSSNMNDQVHEYEYYHGKDDVLYQTIRWPFKALYNMDWRILHSTQQFHIN